MSKPRSGYRANASRGVVFPGFFRRPSEWESAPGARPYRHHLQRAWDSFGLWAVLCVEGKPTVYFKQVAHAELKKEAEWHRMLWNQGTAAMLVVQDPAKTRIYSALAQPRPDPVRDENDVRLAAELDNAAFALEVFLFSVQTGQFYRERPGKFNAETAIDQYLLNNLSAARDLLIDPANDDALPAAVAHAFLGRCLFICYLLEREVIGTAQLKRIGAPIAKKLHRILEGATSKDAVALLFRLFRLLDDDFNGSLFGSDFAAEQSRLRARHIEVLRQLLRGFDFPSKQPVLPNFDFYDFRFIPIELISAIYEDFIVAGEIPLQAVKNQGKSNTVRRKAGAYYTPPRLAELVVDIATEGWDTLLDKRCLDPACGSGIFLVILFQRMAAEWRRRNPRAKNVERALALRRLLTEKLQGVDSDPTACMVACFSLYLAFLDQLEPPDIWKLKATLEKAGEGKVLPPLQATPGGVASGCPVVLGANFFSPEVDAVGKFHLVIGNPPWVGRNQPEENVARKWLFDEDKNPYLATGPNAKAEREARFFPGQQTAIAFMWKTALHVRDDGAACLLLPTRVILSNNTDKFQAAWFGTMTVDAVWQFADYRHILFTGAKCPAVVIKFRPKQPDPKTAEIPYFTPKVERLDPRRASVLVSADEQKTLCVADLLAATAENRGYMFWKMPFWGTDRDRRLLDRLRRMPILAELAGEPGDRKRWIKGQGFQPAGASTTDPKPVFWKVDDAFVDADNPHLGLMLLPVDCEPISHRYKALHRPRNPAIYKAPLVLVSQGFTAKMFSEHDVLFQNSLQSIAGPKQDEDLLLFLAALLNTPLATYYTFHTAANLGVERDKVHFEELLQLPFPLPEQTRQPKESRNIVRAVAARMRHAKKEMLSAGLDDQQRVAAREEAVRDVTESVYRYYDLTHWERALVEDTVNIFEPSKTPTSYSKPIPTLAESSSADRQAYAELLCRTINRWARRSRYSLRPHIRVARSEGFALLTLNKVAERLIISDCPEDLNLSQPIRKLIERIARASVRRGIGGLSYLRGYAHFEGDSVHILKPLSRRHWTCTAALNDADELADYIAGMESAH